MGRLLFLLIAIAVAIYAVRSYLRSKQSARSYDPPPAKPAPRADVPPPALAAPAPAVPSANDGGEIFAKLHQLSLGANAIADHWPASHDVVITAVTAALRGDVTEMRYAPRRPLLLPQLLQAVNDGETSPRQLSNLIARDPALAGSLLQFANSPLYRMNAQPVESVDRAVAVLGFDGIRSLIATALLQPVFRVSSGEFVGYPEMVWEHTFRAATAAEAHAALVEDADPFAAQLIALVMGLAAIIVFRAALDEYNQRKTLRADPSVIAALLDRHTAAVARRIADDWELSGRILAALEDQVPDLGMNKPAALGRSLRFGRMIGALSLLFAHRLLDEDQAKEALKQAGMSGPQVERIWGRLAQLHA